MEIDWNGIVREHGIAVFGVAWRILGHATDAEDVVQEVFLEAQQLDGSVRVSKWGPFLKRIATYRALDRLRRRKPTLPIDESPVIDGDDTPEAIAIGNELAAKLRESITQLPQRQAAVFCLRYFEDMSYEQIAHAVNISKGAVAAAIHKSRSKLKTLFVDVKEGD